MNPKNKLKSEILKSVPSTTISNANASHRKNDARHFSCKTLANFKSLL